MKAFSATSYLAAGDVMAVFYACLIPTSNLQLCIPQFIILAKGKSSKQKSSPLRKIIPLKDITLFLPAHKTMFIVGSSGSRKSIIAQLLSRMYDLQESVVTLNETDMRFSDQDRIKGHVAGVGQQGASGVVILDGKALFENIAIGARLVNGEASKRDVEEACRAALVHKFFWDLPLGYETVLGGGGAGIGLSGGQKQCLSIARAKLRNPTVPILGKCLFPSDGYI